MLNHIDFDAPFLLDIHRLYRFNYSIGIGNRTLNEKLFRLPIIVRDRYKYDRYVENVPSVIGASCIKVSRSSN